MLTDDSFESEFQRLTAPSVPEFTRLQMLQLPTVAQLQAIPDGSECIVMDHSDSMHRGFMNDESRAAFIAQAEGQHGHLHVVLMYVAPETPPAASTLTPEGEDGLESAEQLADAALLDFLPRMKAHMSKIITTGQVGGSKDLLRELIVDTVHRARNGMARLPF